MADDRMTRFDVELFEAAADEGRRNHRSTRQQLEHWTRLGRQISAHETAARRRIVAAKGGEIPLSELATEERTQFFPDGATRPLEVGPHAATQSAEVRSRQSGPTAST